MEASEESIGPGRHTHALQRITKAQVRQGSALHKKKFGCSGYNTIINYELSNNVRVRTKKWDIGRDCRCKANGGGGLLRQKGKQTASDKIDK